MATPTEDAIDTFINITGASPSLALHILQEHGGDLNEAVNAHFAEGDSHIRNPTSTAAPQYDLMDRDDQIQVGSHGSLLPLLSAARSLNPFSLLDPIFRRSFFSGMGASSFTSHAPFVSHPREVREIPIEFNDGNGQSGHSGLRPTIEDVTGTALPRGPEIHGNVIIDDEEEEYIPNAPTTHVPGQNGRRDDFWGDILHDRHPMSSASELNSSSLYGNDIEEEIIQAAIEASKQEVEEGYPNNQFGARNDSSGPGLLQRQLHREDDEFARAISLSLKTGEQEKAMREQQVKEREQELGVYNSADVEELGKLTTTNGWRGCGSSNKGHFKSKPGSSLLQDGAEDVKERPLERHSYNHGTGNCPQHSGDAFHSNEWGGISSEEHDEAIMLEAALFGEIPEGTSYGFPYHPQISPDRSAGPNPRPVRQPPSPSLTAKRLLREQQDDEYLASLLADREKELKAVKEAEARCLKEEESHRKMLEEEEFERRLAAKEASLPREPALDDENAVTLLVRMPDGSRHSRRFLKSDKLQSFLDFIDVGRAVKPGTYRVVRPYPRRTFSDGESSLTLNELGLTCKQEALYLELI